MYVIYFEGYTNIGPFIPLWTFNATLMKMFNKTGKKKDRKKTDGPKKKKTRTTFTAYQVSCWIDQIRYVAFNQAQSSYSYHLSFLCYSGILLMLPMFQLEELERAFERAPYPDVFASETILSFLVSVFYKGSRYISSTSFFLRERRLSVKSCNRKGLSTFFTTFLPRRRAFNFLINLCSDIGGWESHHETKWKACFGCPRTVLCSSWKSFF